MVKKKQVGGKREGAGRKAGPDGHTMVVAATVPSGLVEGLERIAEAEGWTRSKAITEAIRLLLKRKGGA